MDPAPLIQNLDTFVNFVRSRTGDAELAADIVQECLLKAIRSETQPQDDEGSVQWFYRILRHAIIDAHRRRTTRDRALTAFEEQWPEIMGSEDERQLCQCMMAIIPDLPAAEAELLRRVDLGGESPTDRRQVILCLKPEGEQAYRGALAVQGGLANHMLDGISEAQQRDACRLMITLLGNTLQDPALTRDVLELRLHARDPAPAL